MEAKKDINLKIIIYYNEHLSYEILKNFDNKKLCFLCSSSPMRVVSSDLKRIGINQNQFIFIDFLSSHYINQTNTNNCKYLSSPDPEEILESIKESLGRDFRTIIFQSISDLLIYLNNSKIVNLTHNILSLKNVNVIYLINKNSEIPVDEQETLIKDLGMFANEVMNIENKY